MNLTNIFFLFLLFIKTGGTKPHQGICNEQGQSSSWSVSHANPRLEVCYSCISAASFLLTYVPLIPQINYVPDTRLLFWMRLIGKTIKYGGNAKRQLTFFFFTHFSCFESNVATKLINQPTNQPMANIYIQQCYRTTL